MNGAGAAAEDAAEEPMERMVVTGRVILEETPLAPRAALAPMEIIAAAPVTLADLAGLLPSTNLRTNSRGETLAFIRGAGERETAIFLDGAPLNVPWDNRIDLEVLPAGLIGETAVLSGPISARYGARASGGAIELESVAAPSDGLAGGVRAEGGSGDAYLVDLTAGGGGARGSWTAAFGRRARGGVPLPADGGAALAFSQSDPDRRTNTDLAITNGFARARKAFGATTLSASFLISEAAQGVAPESDRDPAEAAVRFWRLPENDLRLLSLAGVHAHGNGARSDGVFYWQAYDQTVESFESAAYEALDVVTREDNATFGGRLVHARPFAPGLDLTVSASGHVSTHDEREFNADGGAGDLILTQDDRFREALLVLGAEGAWAITPAVDLALSASVDRLAVLQAAGADDGGVDPFLDVSFAAALAFRPAPGWSLRAAAGRRPRQPTLRELFGSGVGRFLPNPNLVSERSWAGEIGLDWIARDADAPVAALRTTAFVRDTTDALDQRIVTLDGEDFLERFNRPGARIIGVEAVAAGALADRADWRAQLTWQRARGEEGVFLPERPRILAFGALDYHAGAGVDLRAEIERNGRAFSPDGAGVLRPLEAATRFNLQISWDLSALTNFPLAPTLYVRADNVTDAFLELQAGLPAAGRALRGGVRATF